MKICEVLENTFDVPSYSLLSISAWKQCAHHPNPPYHMFLYTIFLIRFGIINISTQQSECLHMQTYLDEKLELLSSLLPSHSACGMFKNAFRACLLTSHSSVSVFSWASARKMFRWRLTYNYSKCTMKFVCVRFESFDVQLWCQCRYFTSTVWEWEKGMGRRTWNAFIQYSDPLTSSQPLDEIFIPPALEC